VRQWSGLEAYTHLDSRFAYRKHYQLTPWSDCSEVYWSQCVQAYVTQVAQREICVAVTTRNAKQRIAVALQEFPELAERLENAQTTTVERGALTSMHQLERVTCGNVALIGDASGTVDAITGEGLGLSFSQAVVLASCFKSGNLDGYQDAHRRLALRPLLMARLMLTLDGHSSFQQRTLRAFRRHPEVFRRLLALHVGSLSPFHIALDGLTLGWGLLTA